MQKKLALLTLTETELGLILETEMRKIKLIKIEKGEPWSFGVALVAENYKYAFSFEREFFAGIVILIYKRAIRIGLTVEK